MISKQSALRDLLCWSLRFYWFFIRMVTCYLWNDKLDLETKRKKHCCNKLRVLEASCSFWDALYYSCVESNATTFALNLIQLDPNDITVYPEVNKNRNLSRWIGKTREENLLTVSIDRNTNRCHLYTASGSPQSTITDSITMPQIFNLR